MKLLYIHGLGSGVGSGSAVLLRKNFQDCEVEVPEIPIRPKEARDFIVNNFRGREYDLIVASSLGAFYSLLIPGAKKFLINPGIFADTDIAEAIGLGEQEFLQKRSDGATRYTIDEQFIAELAAIRREIYGGADGNAPAADANGAGKGQNAAQTRENAAEVFLNTYAIFASDDELFGHYGHIEDFIRMSGAPERAFRFTGAHSPAEDNFRDEIAPRIREVLGR